MTNVFVIIIVYTDFLSAHPCYLIPQKTYLIIRTAPAPLLRGTTCTSAYPHPPESSIFPPSYAYGDCENHPYVNIRVWIERSRILDSPIS